MKAIFVFVQRHHDYSVANLITSFTIRTGLTFLLLLLSPQETLVVTVQSEKWRATDRTTGARLRLWAFGLFSSQRSRNLPVW
jgi:hypothetical protein